MLTVKSVGDWLNTEYEPVKQLLQSYNTNLDIQSC